MSGDTKTRLAIVAKITGRAEVIDLVNNVAKILTIVVARDSRKLAANATLISTTLDNLAANANVKTQLLALAVNLE